MSEIKFKSYHFNSDDKLITTSFWGQVQEGVFKSPTSVTSEIKSKRIDSKYTECADPIWDELNAKIKEREAFLKTIKGSMTIVNEDSGEINTIYEPVKSGKLSLIVKIR